jgi:hypothetical protein
MNQSNREKVIFEEQGFQNNNSNYQQPESKMVEWVIKSSRGLIKDEIQARYVLLLFVVIAISVSLYLFFVDKNKSFQDEDLGKEYEEYMLSHPN